MNLSQYIEDARLGSMKDPEEELANQLGLLKQGGSSELARPVQASFAEPAMEAKNVVAGLEKQAQINAPAATPEADSGMSGDLAGAGILAGANLASSIMGGQAAVGREKRKIERESASTGAEAKARSSQMAMAGKINPLRQLIASLRR